MVRLSILALVASSVAASLNPLARSFSILDVLKNRRGRQDAREAPEEWFNQKLDHKDPSNAKVWKQLFYTNDEYYGGPGSPVFLYIEGEGPASPYTVTSKGLHMNALAKKHKALLVSVEHRYYGKSQPVPNYTTANLKYLSADQAIEDLTTVQDHVRVKRNLTSDSKWVVFGGSYSAMLAAWARFIHPTRFVGAVASSAPILAKADFFEYADIVAFGLDYYGKKECVDTVKQGLEKFNALVASTKADDVAALKRLFNPCTPIQSDLDRMLIQIYVTSSYQDFAQQNDGQDYNLTTACNYLTAPDGKTPVEKVAEINAQSFACTPANFADRWIKPLSNTTVSETRMFRQWYYQMCSEFGYGSTTTNAKSLFSVLRYLDDEKALYEMCRQAYGIPRTMTDAGIAATNKKYGGLHIDVDNVVFVNGNIDPWSALSITNATGAVNPKSDVVFIDGRSHCGDMAAPTPNDSPSLAWGHQRIEQAVATYLRNQC